MTIVKIGASVNDTYVSEAAPTTNYVGSPLQVRNNVSSSVEEISLINFDLSGETTTNLGKVFLYFYVVSGGDANTSQFTAKRITSSWTGGSVTWNTQPSYTATDAGTVTVDSSDGVWYYINVTELVKTIIGGTNYGISIHDTSTLQDVSTVITQEGFANEAYLELNYIAEDCEESGTIYTGSIYYGWYGDIAHKNLSSGPYTSLCDITPPWTSIPIVDELLVEDVPETYSNGTQRYVITMHDAFIGAETKSAEFTECWWTEDGKRYVKTGGSDSDIGNNWSNAWLTTGYGFQNIPTGKDLYVEEGLYGSETLSNINPSQTMKMYIQPSGHTEAICDVIITDDSITTNFTAGGGVNSNWGTDTKTYLQKSATISTNGILYAYEFIAGGSGYNGDIRFKVFRDDGTNYVFIGESNLRSFTLSANTSSGQIAFTSIPVLSGDYIAFYTTGSTRTTKTSSGSPDLVYRNGDESSTQTKASWSASYLPLNLGIKTYGIH